MEEYQMNPLDELGNVLTHVWTGEPQLTSEKLLEVIRLELEVLTIPNLAKGSNPTLEWSDGITNIFISIHVEDEYHFSYDIQIRPLQR